MTGGRILYITILALLTSVSLSAQKYSILSGNGWKATSNVGTGVNDWYKIWYNDAAWGTSISPSPNPGPAQVVPGTLTMWATPVTDTAYFRYEFELKSTCFTSGYPGFGTQVAISADDHYQLYVNEVLVGQGTRATPFPHIIQPHLRVGKNVIALRASNNSGPFMISFGAEIDYPSGPEIVMDPDKNVCEGDSVFFGPKDNYQSYLWSNGETTRSIKVGKAGKYWLQAMDTAGCTWVDTVELVTYAHNKVDIGPDQTICTGEKAVFDAGAGYSSYRWSTGDTTDTISVNYSGIFWVEVFDANGCSSTDTATVETFDNASVDLGPDTIVCKGDTLILTASFPFSTYRWDDGSNDTFRIVTEAGIYSVTVTNYCGVVTDNKVVDYINNISVDLGPDDYFCSNRPYEIKAEVFGATKYLWSTGDTTYKISVTEGGNYWLEVRDKCGNIGYDEKEIIYGLNNKTLVPSSFSPNNDGINETWRPLVRSYGPYNLQVMNRMGQLVFSSNDPAIEWDGTHNGNKLDNGIYSYRLSYIDCEFQEVVFVGSLTIIR